MKTIEDVDLTFKDLLHKQSDRLVLDPIGPLKQIATTLPCLDRSNECNEIDRTEKLKQRSKSLPCLDSSNECLKILTDAAVANSYRIDAVQTQINIIDTKDLIIGDRIEYVDRKRWVNFFANNPVEMPFKLVANIFGGGDLQRDRIAIADLEVKRATLLSNKARLLANVKEYEYQLREDILELLIEYESNLKALSLLKNRLNDLQFQYRIFLIDYTNGAGNTDRFMSFSTRKSELEFQASAIDTEIYSGVRKLKRLTGYE
ncbi:MAG: hypothetical protein ACFBSE_26605 [Prochloraceae cyanobacterium]